MTGHDGGAVVDAGGPPPANIGACSNGSGGVTCADLTSDHANCGACGKACAATQSCNSGVCTDVPQMTCGSGQIVCLDPSGQKPICTDVTADSRNCGACGNVCTSGACMQGQCMFATQAPAADAGVPVTPPCPGMAANMCSGPGTSSYCADFVRGVSDCGGCGNVCAAGTVCNDGLCMTPPDPSPCGGGLQLCGTGCTSTQDDYRNCGQCGLFCEGSCNSGVCKTAGLAPFGAACMLNGDCAGGLCLDRMRYGWPQGFCSSVCDANLPCAAGQTCVGSPTGGGYGSCRPTCLADSDCHAAGVLCVAGACQPDCRQGPACTSGQMCDPTGRCVTAAPPVCNQPQVTCPTPGGGSSYCADPAKDPNNCGGCGRVCPSGTVCNGGVCGAMTCAAPTTACAGPAGSTGYCADLQHDAANCGACGAACANNAICSGGTCQGGGGSYPGLGACTGPTGAPFCTNLLNDQGNCGRCGNMCAANESCYSGTCASAPPPPTCQSGTYLCKDATAGKQYCSNPLYDSSNCGGCGNVCAANTTCMNGTCVAVASPDGGAMTCLAPARMCATPTGVACINVMSDPSNCGGCGITCGSGQFCGNGICAASGGTDAGTAPPKCVGTQVSCVAPTGAPYCADLSSDSANCGGCQKQCPAGWACSGGTCAAPAAPADAGAP
jgi:hypothetical protein